MSREIRNDTIRRCVLLAPPGTAADLLAKALADRGVDCLRPEDLLQPGIAWSDEMTRHLASADFAVALVPATVPTNVAFEVGLAYGMNKPALVIAAGSDMIPASLRGLSVVRVPTLERLAEAGPEIDRFLRHTKRSPSVKRAASGQPKASNLDWAHSRLTLLRDEAGGRRGFDFERIVADVLEHAGAEVQPTDPPASGRDSEVDLVVWSDDLAYELGGPMLVECKLYRGGVGSVVRNAEHAVKRLDNVVQRSDARLALLVFDHDRPGPIPAISDTPRVLALSVDELIDIVERGGLTQEVLARRGQAAYAAGRLGADRVQ